MKALSKLKPEEGIWMVDVPVPTIGHNEVLIRIKKTAICGTDIHIYNWDEWSQQTIKTPMVVGHEFCGEVVEIGSEVKGINKGDIVSGEGHITCGYCRNCRAGRRHLCRNTFGIGVNIQGAFAEGETPEEAVKELINVIQMIKEYNKERGDPFDHPDVQFTSLLRV